MKQLLIAMLLEYEYEHSFEKHIMSREMFGNWMKQSYAMQTWYGDLFN